MGCQAKKVRSKPPGDSQEKYEKRPNMENNYLEQNIRIESSRLLETILAEIADLREISILKPQYPLHSKKIEERPL